MAGLLAAFLVVVVLYCLARAFVPALRAPNHRADHRADLDAFQGVLGASMVAMLLVPMSAGLTTAVLAASVAGLGWALVRLLRRDGRPAYAPLAVGSAAMVAMTLLPQPATAAAGAHSTHGDGAGSSALVLILLVLLMAVLAARMLDAARRTAPLATRLDAGCDVAMTVSMAYLILLAV